MVSLAGLLRQALPSRSYAQPLPTLAAGMRTYDLRLPGGHRRIHHRVERDGSSLLFVDVTDVIRFNASGALLVEWALSGVSRGEANRRLNSYYLGASARALAKDLAAAFDLADELRRPEIGCSACETTRRFSAETAPLFSQSVEAPYKADLAVTYQCNNDCPHCYNEADRHSHGHMRLEDGKRIIDRLVEVGVPHLIFTGGEATLHPDLPELIAHANAAGPICGLNSNGRRMSHAAYVRELADAGLNHVQVTLGSHVPELHDAMMNARSFDQTVRGLQNAIESDLHAITNTTLMRMNADSIVGTVEFLHSLGVKTFAINGMIYSGGGATTGQALREEEMVPRLIEIRDCARDLGMKFLWYTPTEYCRLSPVELEIGAKRCNAGEYSLCVEPNGDVLPCQSFYAAAGNLLRDPWEQIWRGDLFRSFRDRELDPAASGLPEKCWECPDLPLCGGGCRIEREARDRGEAGCGGCSGGGCSTGKETGGSGSVGGCSSGGCGSHESAGGLVTLELDDAAAKSVRGKRSSGEFRVVAAPMKSTSLVDLDGGL